MVGQIVGYFLKSKKSGKWIKIDQSSGGYPYEVEMVQRAELFSTKTAAERFNAVMSWQDYDNPLYTVHEVSLETTQVDNFTGAQLRDLRN